MIPIPIQIHIMDSESRETKHTVDPGLITPLDTAKIAAVTGTMTEVTCKKGSTFVEKIVALIPCRMVSR